MTTKEFDKVLDEVLESTVKVMRSKSEEYATDDNKLHNFDQGARMTGQTREKVLYGFALKHLISINDIRNDIEKGILPSKELLDEKFGDAINYLILEKASIIDRINKTTLDPRDINSLDVIDPEVLKATHKGCDPKSGCNFSPELCNCQQ